MVSPGMVVKDKIAVVPQMHFQCTSAVVLIVLIRLIACHTNPLSNRAIALKSSFMRR